MRLNKGSGTPTVSLQGCPTGWGGGRGRGCGDGDRIPPGSTGIMSHSNANQIDSHHLLLMYHLRASVSGHRGGGGHRAHLRRDVMEAAVGGAGAAQLAVYARVSHHSERVGVRAGHRQRRAEAGGCNAERRPLRRSRGQRCRHGYGPKLEIRRGFWETHPASPPPRVYRRRSAGRRCCWVSGHRRATWACWTWTPASWTFHSEKTQTSRINSRGESCLGRSEVSDSPD